MNEIESKAVDAAYAENIRSLVCVLFNNYVEAGDDATKQKDAEEHFRRGASLARRVHERAVAVLSV